MHARSRHNRGACLPACNCNYSPLPALPALHCTPCPAATLTEELKFDRYILPKYISSNYKPTVQADFYLAWYLLQSTVPSNHFCNHCTYICTGTFNKGKVKRYDSNICDTCDSKTAKARLQSNSNHQPSQPLTRAIQCNYSYNCNSVLKKTPTYLLLDKNS